MISTIDTPPPIPPKPKAIKPNTCTATEPKKIPPPPLNMVTINDSDNVMHTLSSRISAMLDSSSQLLTSRTKNQSTPYTSRLSNESNESIPKVPLNLSPIKLAAKFASKASAKVKEVSSGQFDSKNSHMNKEKLNSNVVQQLSTPLSTGRNRSITDKGDLLLEGELIKVSTEAVENVYHVSLYSNYLVYTEPSNIGIDEKLRIYRIENLMAFDNEKDYIDEYGFRVLGKEKSWRMRAYSKQEKEEWLTQISKIAREKQKVHYSILWKEEDLAPIYVMKGSVSNCEICVKSFGMYGLAAARHHCRNCGKVVCESCSRERVRIERFDDNSLVKVCSLCAKEIKNHRKYGH